MRPCAQDSDKDKLRSSLGQAIMVERPNVKVRCSPGRQPQASPGCSAACDLAYAKAT